jgi:hypothetical protein
MICSIDRKAIVLARQFVSGRTEHYWLNNIA